MKRTCSIALVILAVAFVGAGAYSITQGRTAKQQVRRELLAQRITTPADASIPNARVDDVRSAESLTRIVDKHAREATGGKTYAELGRFAATSGDRNGTSDETKAVIGPTGRPVPNPVRGVAFEASAVRTGLYTSIMAFHVSDLVVGLGLMMMAIGVVLAGAGIGLGRRPAAHRVGVTEPEQASNAALTHRNVRADSVLTGGS